MYGTVPVPWYVPADQVIPDGWAFILFRRRTLVDASTRTTQHHASSSMHRCTVSHLSFLPEISATRSCTVNKTE